ncbi:Sulfotransferase domain-containing protein [Psychroflexus salarius]|uniref:Sulfotransferase domain-containing protein n=1 Tax=Psychroflexus salarius TaxID=1155689 RepID=A0A1M4X4H7_9FLAO|nr:sulfotransferase domain-containing protein [Psychroflexus salarius]SHE88102.1 Sulfotransferase domain-containing protein [Psychroflexus salarius]
MALRTVQKKIERQYFNWKIELKPEQNILFFGDPRGGTTWMGETLSQLFDLPLLWEPMLARKDSRFSKFNFAARPYLPEDLNEQAIKKAFSDLFDGKNIDHWEIQHTTPKKLAKRKAALIKFTRGNMLLPYLTANFHFEKKPIYMLRNPFAVVASQLKHFGWQNMHPRFQIPRPPYNQLHQPHHKFLKTLNTKHEVLLAHWVIANQYVLNHPRNNIDWISINYEETLKNPQDILQHVFKRWCISEIDFSQVNFSKKSRTSLTKKEVTIDEQLSNWKKSFTSKEINQMENVLNYFNFRYADD